MEEILQKFNNLTAKPVNFLVVQNNIKDDVKNLVKNLYDFTKNEESKGNKKKGTALPELIIEDFDEEQIWQQIELQNSERWDDYVWNVANCISNKSDLKFPVEISYPEPEEDQASHAEAAESEENETVITEKERTPKKKQKKSKVKSSVVDDKFFKLSDMEQFLLSEEKMEEKGKKKDDDEESIDLFQDIDEDSDDNEDMKYKDFFKDDSDVDEDHEMEDEHLVNHEDKDDHKDDNDDNMMSEQYEDVDNDEEGIASNKKGKSVRFAGLQPDSDSESDSDESIQDPKVNGVDSNEKKSEFELRQERLKQTISRLEEKTLKEAPWQLKGEVDANKRPQNSLLEEVVDFDLTTRPAPIITEHTTITLEGLIRQRIKDKAWDDVVKKEKPVDDQLSFKKPEILDHSKSKLSLAQVYEAEYLKQKQAASGDTQEEEEPESHKEVREAMSKLFAKLDALCHYHYTPKPAQAEVKIVSNTPAISMEEVAPVATSEAALLAPEEIKKKQKGALISKEERTETDKKRERRKKKKMQQKKGQVMKVTDHRNTKKGVEASDKSLKTSKAFFQQLNEDATSIIKKNKNKKK